MDPPEVSQEKESADMDARRLTYKQQTSSRILENYPEARDVTPCDDHPGETIAVSSRNIIPAFPVAEAVPQQQQQQTKHATEFHQDATEFQQQQKRSREDPLSADEEMAALAAKDNNNSMSPPGKKTATIPLSLSTDKSNKTNPRPSRWNRRTIGIFVAAILVVTAVVVTSVLLALKSEPPILHVQSLDLDGEIPNDNFGSAVALSRNGKRLAVASSGSVSVYEKEDAGDDGESWERMGETIVVDPNPPRDELNERNNVISIHLNEYGDYLVLGYGGGDEDVGFAEIYRFIQGVWVSQTNLSLGSPGDRFGASVSINNVGSVIAVGAPGHQNNTGCVYSYQVGADGEWKLRNGDIEGTMVGGEFGGSISLSKTGTRIAVGGRTVVSEESTNYAVVQIYEFNRFGDSIWTKLGSGLPNNQRLFSTSWMVDLSADGDRYVASNAYTKQEDFQNTAPDTLVVQAFRYDGTSWVNMGENIHQGIEGPKSGYFVSLSDDGLSMCMGDPGTSSGESRGNGHAHIYKFVNDDQWEQHGLNQNGEADLDLFGFSVAIAGDGSHFVAGAPLRSFAANDAGRVQTFAISAV